MMGRQKIPIEFMKNKEARTVTFSKRRNGLFKKANELATLCGAEVGILVFSLSGKPFSYGSPNLDHVINKHIFHKEEHESGGARTHGEPSINGNIEMINMQYDDVMKVIEVEKKKKERLDKALNEYQFFKGKVFGDGMDSEELKNLKDSVEMFRDEFNSKVKMYLNDMEAASSLLLLAEKSETEIN